MTQRLKRSEPLRQLQRGTALVTKSGVVGIFGVGAAGIEAIGHSTTEGARKSNLVGKYYENRDPDMRGSYLIHTQFPSLI